ncbi:MAG: hypothetical protein IKG32_09165 [Clostridia bacterium]|nr:hypothetical protein [Clostridia bacterium]
MRQIVLSMREVTAVLNICYNSAYELFEQPDFPKFWLFRTYCVRVDRFYYWMVKHGCASYCPPQWAEAFGETEN